MLYDPKWEVKTKPDVFSLGSLIAWLEKQPADKKYDYSDPKNCLLGQWLCHVTGFTGAALSTKSCAFGLENQTLARVAYPSSPRYEFDYSFGSALTRARAAFNAEER